MTMTQPSRTGRAEARSAMSFASDGSGRFISSHIVPGGSPSTLIMLGAGRGTCAGLHDTQCTHNLAQTAHTSDLRPREAQSDEVDGRVETDGRGTEAAARERNEGREDRAENHHPDVPPGHRAEHTRAVSSIPAMPVGLFCGQDI